MSEAPQARVKKTPSWSFVWFVPALCAACMAVFAYGRYRDLGPEIRIKFPQAQTLIAGKTKIEYLGVRVGVVTGLKIDEDGKGVTVTARLDRSAAVLARKGTTFVVVKPEVSFEGIRDLTTIFAGSSLLLKPGNGDPAVEFKGYTDERAAARDEPGLELRFAAARIGALQEGDPVLNRGVRVGAIEEVELGSSDADVVLRAKIEPRYARFVRTNTTFWESSGVRAKFGLFGAKVSMDSVQGLLRGGVSFATPEPPGDPAEPGASYALKPEPVPGWEKWSPKL